MVWIVNLTLIEFRNIETKTEATTNEKNNDTRERSDEKFLWYI